MKMLTRKATRPSRLGFTLIELLIVVSILVVLLTMTAALVDLNSDQDRVRQGARQVQSFLLGARDRALRTGENVGVRFFFGQPADTSDADTRQLISRQVSAMAYISQSGTWPPEDGARELIEHIEEVDLNSDMDTNDAGEVSIFSSSTAWWSLKRRGWLIDGLLVRIPDSPTGDLYQIDTSEIDVTVAPPAVSQLRLVTPNNGRISAGMTYSIQLPWALLPEEGALLPENVVIDLDASRIPVGWRPRDTGDTENYRSYIDVVFSPRGTLVGDAAAGGLLHFYVCDAEDSMFLKERFVVDGAGFAAFNTQLLSGNTFVPVNEMDPTKATWLNDTYVVKPRRLVTVVPQTGSVSVHDVYGYVDPESEPDPADLDSDGIADDPYRFAETGETSL